MDLKKKMEELKNKSTKLNEASIKMQQEVQMLRNNLSSNEASRIGIAAQIKLVEDLLKESKEIKKNGGKNA